MEDRPGAKSIAAKAGADLALDDLPMVAARLDGTGRITHINRAWRRFAEANGYVGPDLGLGRNYLEICRAATGPSSGRAREAADGIADVLAGRRGSFSLQYDCHAPSEERWYKLIAARQEAQSGAIVLHVDVTAEALSTRAMEQRRAEAEADRLRIEQAMRARSRFVAAAGHDLRQPLQAAELFLGLLRGAAETDRADITRILRLSAHLGTALGALREILDGLDDLSKLESGSLPLRVETFPIQRVISQLGAEAHALASHRGLDIRTVRSSALVRTDRQLLTRIGRNLVSNAIRYTSLGRVMIGARRRDGFVDLTVCDTGIGIKAEHIDAIFEEFYQVGNAERDRRKGMGLGLSIVKRVADVLDLRVGVRSVPGRGSCFHVAIPAVGAGVDGTRPDRAALPQ